MRDPVETILLAQDAASHLARLSKAFAKADAASVAFSKTGAGTVSLKAGTTVAVAGVLLRFAADTPVTMPALTAGTDYAIYACVDGALIASANWSAPDGYTTGNSRKIGGFHYAPGGNAAAQAGGDTTPAINEYSLWDIKFRPACADPRGMALVGGAFWSDIYLLGVNHHVDGSSRYNVTIADGSSPPKVPSRFGGDGSTAYSNLNWWVAGEVMRSHGKRLPTYSEFAALAYGTTEAASGGTDPVSTILRAASTSKWGVTLSTGNLWVWGDEFGGGAAAASWTANTIGRGSTYQMENAALFGGHWGDGSYSGSRASLWGLSPPDSAGSIGVRGVCDHVTLD
ncbi:MAG: hypothetical protein IPG66_05845 [Hydrogenophilales bacterium]|nr:hypothetical protein [Hydrogenophilales bacterium]